MVWDAVVHIKLVTAVVVFFLVVFADCCPLLYGSFVEYLGANVLETHALGAKVRNRITVMSDSSLEVVLPVNLVEPDSKVRVAHSWTSKGVELSHLNLIGQEMSDGMSGNGSPKTMPGDTI